MRKINKVILHCSDTESDNSIDVDVIRKWHLQRGFNDIGYHFLIRPDGFIQVGRPIEKIGAHCKGHNVTSIGICLIGGRKDGEPCTDGSWVTIAQIQMLNLLLFFLSNFYDFSVFHHRDFDSSKTCPNFDLQTLKLRYHENFS